MRRLRIARRRKTQRAQWRRDKRHVERLEKAAALNASSTAELPARFRRPPPDDNWLCYWNADLRVELADILKPLEELVRGARPEPRPARAGRRLRILSGDGKWRSEA